jgi:hypothetical protein
MPVSRFGARKNVVKNTRKRERKGARSVLRKIKSVSLPEKKKGLTCLSAISPFHILSLPVIILSKA